MIVFKSWLRVRDCIGIRNDDLNCRFHGFTFFPCNFFESAPNAKRSFASGLKSINAVMIQVSASIGTRNTMSQEGVLQSKSDVLSSLCVFGEVALTVLR
jgi:hypothetical protein